MKDSKFEICVSTKAEKRAAILLLHKLTGASIGKEWDDGKGGIKETSQMNLNFPYIYVRNGEINCSLYTGSAKVYNYSLQLPEIIKLLTTDSKEYVVENVGDYKASITDTGIEVGCQKISFDKLQEIVDKVAEFKANQ